MFALLACVSVLVGLLIGTMGIGGILLIPSIELCTRLNTHQSMATALFSFIFVCALAAWLCQRHGTINWRLCVPVCLGGVSAAFVGARLSVLVSGSLLTLVLAGIIIFAGVYTLFPARGGTRRYVPGPAHDGLLLGIGLFAGLASGLTGVGGAVLFVPVMLIAGFTPIVVIATTQVLQIVSAISGSLGNAMTGTIDYQLAFWLVLLQALGVGVGVRLAHATASKTLVRAVAFLCIVLGILLGVRALGQSGFLS